ncbi:MAG: DnaJ C-terminal domain-containing protein, partial [Dehalococcoidia bacterium]
RGIVEETAEIEVTVPPGADTGHRIRIPGEGEQGDDLAGDLYIVLEVQEHPIFRRHGDDIYLEQEIDFTTAALGGQVGVAGLSGALSLDIHEGTQTGAVFKMEGEGVPHLGGYGKGDQYVVVKVITPTDLNPREKDLLKEFGRLRDQSGGRGDEQA